MATEAASVEVLTAEVRTLMVGSRQVTLSVYRQLDEVKFTEMDPFGRVRGTSTGDKRNWIEVVGARKSDHSLCRASIYGPGDEMVDGEVTRVYKHPYLYLHYAKHALATIATVGASEFAYGPQGAVKCHVVWEGEPDSYKAVGLLARVRCRGTCDKEDLWQMANDRMASQLADLTQSVVDYGTASALPLIVLAGLR